MGDTLTSKANVEEKARPWARTSGMVSFRDGRRAVDPMNTATSGSPMVQPTRPSLAARVRCCALAAATAVGCGNSAQAAHPAEGGSRAVDAATAPLDAAAADSASPTPDAGAAPLDSGTEASANDATLDGGGGDGGDAGEDASDACASATVSPPTLDCTGLYADLATKNLAPGVRPYQPAVVLWSDGAQKARFIQLPPGTQIDATDPTEWRFPVGTKVWKEFSKNGHRVETRLFQKVDDGPPPIWVHATYAWNADESAAVASGGGDITLEDDGGSYHIPTFSECDQCHNGRTDHVLGFEQVALGLAGAQGLTLPELVAEGLIAPAPAQTSLALGDDGTGAAAPAVAWLHINCGVTCHNANSNATAYGVGMRLRLDPAYLDGRALTPAEFDTLRTTLGVPAVSPGWVAPVHWTRIVPGDSNGSLLAQLISHRGKNNPAGGQMPPIATSIVDTADVANVVAWIDKMPGADAGADADAGAPGD